MRKHQQRQILQLLKTIEQAQSEGLYADCQTGAVSIGRFIESIEGEGTKTVALLEEYCELLFKASKGEIKSKQLRKHLIKVENSVWSELKPNRIEIVFISYNSSMSDSLESIYMAGKADPNCDAYWIPVPYYERRSDGSFGEMHYEGADCYDDNIECTDWREYDIDARHPDVIFTFAPYDNGNFVTSVHPVFYCERLHALTELLVYIPYFVVTDDVSEHFCTVAGCIYANKVIVQSEKIRDTYIRVFEENFGSRFGKPKDKFVALGSPKFDKAINAKREDYILPDEWRERTDNRTVIFYNTSIGAILQGNEQYLKKLRNVLDTFRSSNDMALWWRPHPLSSATYQSMRPQIADEYERIVAEYKSGGWGIYDDTPDLHRAIAWSGAYYGDMSSVVELVKAAGKMVLLQNINEIADDWLPETAVRFKDFEFDSEGNVWGFEMHRDGLFKLNFQNNTADFVLKSGSIPQHKGKKYNNHRYITIRYYEDEIICFPYFQNEILVYNLKNKAHQKISIDRNYLLSEDGDGFSISAAIERDGKFHCFSWLSKAVIVFDATTKTIEYHSKLYSDYDLFCSDGIYSKYPIYHSQPDKDGNVEILFDDFDKLIKYNLDTQNSNIIAENTAILGCNKAVRSGDCFWIVNQKDLILKEWALETNTVSDFPILVEGFIHKKSPIFSGMADCGAYLLLLPAFANMIIRFDKETKTFSEYSDIPVASEGYSEMLQYYGFKRVENKMYFCAFYSFTIYELDLQNGKVTEHKLKSNFPDTATMLDFINEEPVLDTVADGQSGERIYNYVKSYILGNKI